MRWCKSVLSDRRARRMVDFDGSVIADDGYSEYAYDDEDAAT